LGIVIAGKEAPVNFHSLVLETRRTIPASRHDSIGIRHKVG